MEKSSRCLESERCSEDTLFACVLKVDHSFGTFFHFIKTRKKPSLKALPLY